MVSDALRKSMEGMTVSDAVLDAVLDATAVVSGAAEVAWLLHLVNSLFHG